LEENSRGWQVFKLQEPDETLYQAWEHFKELLMKCPQHYLTEMQEVILFYNGLDVPTRQILDSRGTIPTKTAADAKTAIQEMAEYSQKWHNETSRGRNAVIRNQGASIKTLDIQIGQMSKSISTTIEADSHSIRRIGSSQYVVSTGQNNTLLYKSRQTTIPFPSRLDYHYCKEEEGNYEPKSRKLMELHISITSYLERRKTQGVSLYLALLIIFSNALVDLGASVSVMPLSNYLNLGLGELAHTRLTVELANRTVKYPKGIAENVLVGIDKFTFQVDFIILDMPEDIKVPLILGIPFLSTAHDKIDVYKRNITLRVEEEDIIFKSVKPTSSLIKRVYMLSLRERMEFDLEARLMG
ncbi:retrovirus-related pol polyprotein from transposon TNT 1-94, partial [Tanacetum coccineum]